MPPNIARRFQTSGPRILYQGFTDHCKSVLENGEPNPLTRLHKNNLRDSFLHESVKKLYFSLVVSDYALKYSGLGSSKYQKDASDFKIFPGEHSPSIPPHPLARLHENDLQDSFLRGSVEKDGVFSCNIRICSEICWIRQFYLLAKIPKRHNR